MYRQNNLSIVAFSTQSHLTRRVDNAAHSLLALEIEWSAIAAAAVAEGEEVDGSDEPVEVTAG